MSIDFEQISVAAPTEAEKSDPNAAKRAADEAAFFSEPEVANDEHEEMDLKERQHNLDLRNEYARKAYAFVKGSVTALFAVIAAVIFLNTLFNAVVGPAIGIKNFVALSDKVLIALISGVTVNVLAVFLVVVRNLFPAMAKDKAVGTRKSKRDIKKAVAQAVKRGVEKTAKKAIKKAASARELPAEDDPATKSVTAPQSNVRKRREVDAGQRSDIGRSNIEIAKK